MVLTVIFSAITSSLIVNADELDGYTKVDWSWNRDMETTDANSVIVGGNIPFWRYVNKTSPANNNAIWKSIYGDELSDDDVTKIWLGDIDKRYVVASVDVANIPDENIRQYIYDHIDEDLPDLKFKFDIDADVEGNSNLDKAKTLFDGDIGYRVYRDGDTCRIEIKFSPKFYLTDNKDNSSDEPYLPYMPHKPLPKARYPYSSVIFSMWGYEGGSNEHYGALEVVEGNDPKYIYGQSFGYGDILEKGKIPNNMVYPNFEAGEINQEGTWAGTFESDISHLTNNDYPVMKDIYDLIEFEITKLDMKKKRGENVSTVEYNDYVQLRGLMKDIAVGGDSFIWNGETTIHSDSKVVALDTSGFAEGNEKLKKIQYFNVLTWVWEQASQNREERCIIVADEAYMMIDQRVPTALIHMRNMAKRGRKYNVSIMTISHSVVDFLAPAIKQYGQELIGTSCYKMFFGCEGQNLLELSNLYDLKEAERDFLLGAEQGYALAQFGSKRVIVHFKVGDYKKRRISGGGEGVETKKKNTSNRDNVVWQSVNA